ncbi:DUF934 domain-containing protein [Marinomonas piezotolerans]|uniref:DUF934 domain-containing protein n=1 Tax=Marinomonas piezotolerans TaxID=2213058 RepID=A0A370UEA0_9GAMM|nr:DUF934 domain-containing protein [Marinomonas piezotolerans]RDL46116.1 DUF934 domain-containing protein [Marinomonas piezotolerans]
MPKLIKNGEIVDNTYVWQQDAESAITENAIVPMQKWLDNRDNIGTVAGIWIDAGEGIEPLEGVDLSQFKVIGVHFPSFMDGRGFSYARLLRERLHYKGEIRALGNFMADQQGYLIRCGVDSFQFAEDVNLDIALTLNKPFSVAYQGDVSDPRPVFLRRT